MGGFTDISTAEIDALHRFYPGIVVNGVTFRRPLLSVLLTRPDVDIVSFSTSVRGTSEDLIRHRFMHRDWLSVAACGTRHHSTKGFGSANVYRLKSGQYRLAPAYLDHMLDLLAPVLTPLYWTPGLPRHA